eukprot:TRINITY_DN5143_c0_g1_i1.p1 TRINITY_DN5143_c0_g1~~TRINITY_DN5143_c0_g1_i1.p1  ORF type:complete len:152 (+),score=12.31 TRINITY_DN5143_c0_g1_i1:784-1239(+)
MKPVLLAKLFKDKMKWSTALKAAECAYNKHLVSATTGMLLHHVVYGKLYNCATCNNLRKHLETMERIRRDVKTRSIATKISQSTQYDKNKKDRSFTSKRSTTKRPFHHRRAVECHEAATTEPVQTEPTGESTVRVRVDYRGQTDRTTTAHW